jgi:hypothetical protein
MCAKIYSGDLRFARIVNLGSSLPCPQENKADWQAQVGRPSLDRRHTPQTPFMPGPSSRSANGSPLRKRMGSQTELQSPTTSPRKQPPGVRKGSIWDSFFQYDITYQGGSGKAKK